MRTRPRDHEVTYRRYGDEKRPGWVHVLREDSGLTEALSSRWHQGAEGYARSAFLGAAGDHPYAAHLLQDACNLAYLSRRQAPRQLGALYDAVEAFVTEVLNPRGETYTISATEILVWLKARGLVVVAGGVITPAASS